jgi:hypothetical protein
MKTLETNNKRAGGIKVNSLLLLLIGGEKRTYCYWCGQKLNSCEACKGKGYYNHRSCERCNGTGVLCATHDKMWD